MALSDAKQLDAQAGLETGMGAMLAALSGINSISGPGMLDFESCQSLEKLVVDNEICGMTYRLLEGIEPREDFPASPSCRSCCETSTSHSRPHSPLPAQRDRVPRPNHRSRQPRTLAKDGKTTLRERASREVERLIARYTPSRLPDGRKAELTRLMETEAKRHGMAALPAGAN